MGPPDWVHPSGGGGSNRHTDFEWTGWYGKDGSFTVDLGKRASIKKVTLGCLTNSGMGVHTPSEIRLLVSDDNKTFRQVASAKHSLEEIFKIRTAIEDEVFDLNTRGRYLKVEFTNPGKCPVGDFKEGQEVWKYFDEIIVE